MRLGLAVALLCGMLGGTAPVLAQIGGRYVYEFMRNPASARLTALGGTNISLVGQDPFMPFGNPALATESAHGQLGFSAISFLAGSGYGTLAYVHHVKNIGSFFGGLQYQNSGRMTRTDVFGNELGEFSANDLNLNLAGARSFGRFQFGLGVSFIYSNIDAYSSVGLSTNLGASYYWEEQDFGVGLAMRNLGAQLTPYVKGAVREELPLDVQVGLSKRVPKTPFRFSLTLHNLQQPTLLFEDESLPQEFDLNGNPIDDGPSTVDQVFAHTIWGVELLLGKKQTVQLRGAYNHQRRAELKLADQSFALNGFSFGVGLRIYRFNFDYGFAQYFARGGVHHFGISTNWQAWTGSQGPARSSFFSEADRL